MAKNLFRVVFRHDRMHHAFIQYAILPDQAATPGRVAYMQFDVNNGKIVAEHFDEMPISYYHDWTAQMPKSYVEQYYSPTCGIFDIVREYLKSGSDPVEGDVVLRYRLPDLSKTAWKQYLDIGREK